MNNKHSWRSPPPLPPTCDVLSAGYILDFVAVFFLTCQHGLEEISYAYKQLQQIHLFLSFHLDFYFELLFKHTLWRKNVLFLFVVWQKGVVLVHCNAGVSRSSAIAIGYLMQREGLSFGDAYSQVKLARPSVHPNRGFYQQLQSYNPQGCWTVFFVLVFTVGSAAVYVFYLFFKLKPC